MIYDYIVKNYQKGDPIFLSELPGASKDYVRQETKRLADEGRLERLYNGVYFLPYTTILGTKGKVSMDRYIDKKYLSSRGKTSGYITGLQLANQLGFTTKTRAVMRFAATKRLQSSAGKPWMETPSSSISLWPLYRRKTAPSCSSWIL